MCSYNNHNNHNNYNNYDDYGKVRTLQDFRGFIEDKSVSVVGIGISNIPLLKFLQKCGVKKITARDKKNEKDIGGELTELENINYILGENYLADLKEDVIFKTPGIRRDLPCFIAAEENGSIVTSEMELFFMMCPAKTIAITGSEGKTTITTIIGEILKSGGKTVYVGGNIGTPLLGEIENMNREDYVVAELSSFQLFDLDNQSFKPDYAVIINITPNHLDWHKNMREYIDAKKIIYKNQNQSDRVVLSYDNDLTRNLKGESKSGLFFFSMNILPDEYKNGVYYDNCNHSIFLRKNGINTKIMERSDILIGGEHNVENFMAAISVTHDIVGIEAIKTTAKIFGGVEHRIEFVRELDGISYYDSTIDSSPTRTIAALNYFDDKNKNKKIIVILGGSDKNVEFDPLAPVVFKKAKAAVLYGATREKIKKCFDDYKENNPDCGDLILHISDSFDSAVIKTKEFAASGDVVLLSPACASFDCFKNFEERGNRFKEIVNAF